MFGDILQPTHLIFILVVALLVLGPKRLPEVGRSLGKGIRDFRGAMAGLEEHTSGLLSDAPPVNPATTPMTPATVATEAPEAPLVSAPLAQAVTAGAGSVVAPAAAAAQEAAVEPDPSEYAD